MTIKLLNIILITVVLIGVITSVRLIHQIIVLYKASKEQKEEKTILSQDMFVMGDSMPLETDDERTLVLFDEPEEARMLARLKFLRYMGMPTERMEILTKEKSTIGRGGESDIIIHDKAVSKCHATIYIGQDGISISDNTTTNGTLVNGDKLKAGIKTPLGDDDIVSIGSTSFIVIRV